MSKKGDIRNEGLADKLAGFNPEPPEAVWEGISSQIQAKKSKRGLFVWFLAAAGLLMAVSVGVRFLFPAVEMELAVDQKNVQEQEMISSPEEGFSDEIIQPEGNVQSERIAQSQRITQSEEFISTLNDEKVEPDVSQQRPIVLAEESQAYSAKEKRTRIEERVMEVFEEVKIAEHNEVAAGYIEIAEKDSICLAEERIESDSLLLDEKSEEELITALVPTVIPFEEEAKKKGKWQFGAALSPQYSYRDVASPDMMQNAKVNSAESGKVTYAGGFNVSYLPNDRLTLESGVFYNKMGVNIGDYSVFGFLDDWKELDYLEVNENRGEQFVNISNSMGTVMARDNSVFVANYGTNQVANDLPLMSPQDMLVEGSRVDYLSQSFGYLEIPFNLKYKIYDKDFIVQIIGGFSTNFLIGNTLNAVTSSNDKVNIGSVANVRSVNYSGNAGIGVLYDLFDNFTLSVEPRLRYYLNSVNTDYLPVTRPYALGFYTGVSYSF